VKFSLPNTHEVIREGPATATERKPRRHLEGVTPSPGGHRGEPRPQRYYGPGYNPRWVMKQLILALTLLGWQRSGAEWGNPDNGEHVPERPYEIIETLIGRPLDNGPWDSLIACAGELSAEATLSERDFLRLGVSLFASTNDFGKSMAAEGS